MEVREILSKYDYDGDNAIVIKGSALAACNDTEPAIGEQQVLELLRQMDQNVEVPPMDLQKPFMLSVEGTFTIAGRGTVATGTVE